jgi:hypothetical protein
MPKRVEDIKPPQATLTAGLERGISHEVEREREVLPFTYDQRQRVFRVLSERMGSQWPDAQSDRNRMLNDALQDLSAAMEEEFGPRGWPNASPGERDMMLGAVLKARYGSSGAMQEAAGPPQPKPKPKGDWFREHAEFLSELRAEDAERAYLQYVERVKAGRIKP